MNHNLKTYLQILKAHGQQNNIPNVSETVGQFLNMMIKIKQPKQILEIGSANGYSTIWMAEAARKVDAKIYTLDHSKPTFAQLEKNLEETGFSNIVSPYFGKALEVISDFPGDLKFDFIFVDGQKAQYLEFWHAIQSRLADKAMVIFDDMTAFPEKTKAFSEFLKTLEDWDQLMLPLDEGDGVLVMMPS